MKTKIFITENHNLDTLINNFLEKEKENIDKVVDIKYRTEYTLGTRVVFSALVIYEELKEEEIK